MQADKAFVQHLKLNEMTVAPGQEWTPDPAGWLFMRVSSGVAYWMHPRKNLELDTGAVLVRSAALHGIVHVSQLGPARFHFFQVEPDRLAGVVTLSEKQFLETAAKDEEANLRLLASSDPVAQKFGDICGQRSTSSLRARLQLLELFIRTFDARLGQPAEGPILELGAKARLQGVLQRMPSARMLDLSFSELVEEVRCTPRHLSRLFQEVVGMSFREKQAEVRLARARELLETTSSKIYEVALESRYPSVSLFNFMFKKRFGVTPALWRVQLQRRKAQRSTARGLLLRRPTVERACCV